MYFRNSVDGVWSELHVELLLHLDSIRNRVQNNYTYILRVPSVTTAMLHPPWQGERDDAALASRSIPAWGSPNYVSCELLYQPQDRSEDPAG